MGELIILIDKAKNIMYRIKNLQFTKVGFNNIRKLSLRLKDLLYSRKFQSLVIILASFLISMEIFSSITWVLVSTISIIMIFKIIKKNSSKINILIKNIMGDRVLSSMKKYFNIPAKEIGKKKYKDLKDVFINNKLLNEVEK